MNKRMPIGLFRRESRSTRDKDNNLLTPNSSPGDQSQDTNDGSNGGPNESRRNVPLAYTDRVGSDPDTVLVGGGMSQSSMYRVRLPDSVRPCEEFRAYAGSRIVLARCAPDGFPGQSLPISVPLIPDSPHVTRVFDSGSGPNSRPAYMVTVPAGVRGGQPFPVTIAGHHLLVICPLSARPGNSLRIVPPTPPPNMQRGTDLTRLPDPSSLIHRTRPQPQTQLFEVTVPPGVQPRQPFALPAEGVHVLVECPANAIAGQRIRFNLPVPLNEDTDSAASIIKLSYDKHGWTRTIRITDMRLQWIRMDEKETADLNKRFDIEKSAHVRKLEFVEGINPCMRGGKLSLVPASEAVVDFDVMRPIGKELVTYADIAAVQVKTFEDKVQWFQANCAQLSIEWNEGHMRMNVRREFLLGDSMEAVLSLSRDDLRKIWKFEFVGEKRVDAGGLAREWFQLVTEEIFDPNMGLWQSSAANQMCMQINPASEILCPEDHLVYFRFLGRVMGKAVFDRQLISGHMVPYLYKHILGWPVVFGDLEGVDEEHYNNLKQLRDIEDIEMMGLHFTITEETLGLKKEVELVEHGANMVVTANNLPEYLEACWKYRMMGRVKTQINELLLGFFDVIPEPLLAIFDFQELELLMCGLPEIDVNDWKANTEYSGEYDLVGVEHQACRWFWEVVSDYDQEMKARLLYFVTGTSAVPSRGFGLLPGNDGGIRKFTIYGVPIDAYCLYPRSQPCFNRIDLPMYDSKEVLEERLTFAVEMVAAGFDYG